jgi:hypothetical protein
MKKKKSLSKKQQELLLYKIEAEGFTDAFTQWGWMEIKDKEFHKLRVNLVTAVVAMEDYINEKTST